MVWFIKGVLATGLVVLGLFCCAYGVLILTSIPSSDTSTGTLVRFAAALAIPGLVAMFVGAWLLRRSGSRG